MVKNIQALRGIAAALVLWTHLKFSLCSLMPGYRLPSFLSTDFGAIGVDIFFAISGYVISLSAVRTHHGPIDFYAARLARVVPLYFVTTLLLVGVKLIIDHQAYFARALWNGFFFLPVFDFGSYTLPPNELGWTLCYEMWFYIIFALFLCFFPAFKVVRLLPIFFGVLAVAMIPYRGAWIFPAFASSPFVLEFSAGCLVYIFQDRIRGLFAWLLLTAGIIYLLVFSMHTSYLATLKVDHPMLIWQRIGLWGFPSALIVAGMVGLERAHGLILPKILVWLGKISFSFYIVQRINISFVVFIGSRFRGWSAGEVIALAVSTNLLLAYACWRMIERPLTVRARAFFDSLLFRRTARAGFRA